MKGLFWNIRGMGQVEKTGHLQDLIKEKNIDFVGIMETIKQDFSAGLLRGLSGNKNMKWEWLPAMGHSGGILVGINIDKLSMLAVSKGDFHVKIELQDMQTNFCWDLIAVYGAAQNAHKDRFLTELANIIQKQMKPLVMGGDFNIIRKESDKNKAGGYNRWSFIFNAVIEQANLREIFLGGRKFTWCNNQENPTLEKLDRIFVNTDWEKEYPLTMAKTLTRSISDHNPLLIDTGVLKITHKSFKFELSWFLREDLKEIVESVWKINYYGSSIERWQKRFRALRKKLNGWNNNWEGRYRREKESILEKIENLDAKVERCGMSKEDREERKELEDKLNFVIREEKIKWFQRSKENELLEGDCNTKYYHAKANGRKRKSYIHSLTQEEGEIEGQEKLLTYITSFYKDLFGHPKQNTLFLDMRGVTTIMEEHKVMLTKPFSEEEVRIVVFELKKNKAPGPDGFIGEFYT